MPKISPIPKKIIFPVIMAGLTALFIFAGLPHAFAESRVVTTVEDAPTPIPGQGAKVFKDQHGKPIKQEHYDHDGNVVQRDHYDKDGKLIRSDSFYQPPKGDTSGKESLYIRTEYGHANGERTTTSTYDPQGHKESTQFFDENGHYIKYESYDRGGKVTETIFFYRDKNGKLLKRVVLTDTDNKLIKAGVIQTDKYGRPIQGPPPSLDNFLKGASSSMGSAGTGYQGAGTTFGGDIILNVPGMGNLLVVEVPSDPGAYEGPPSPPFFGGITDPLGNIFFGEGSERLDRREAIRDMDMDHDRVLPGGDADRGTPDVENILDTNRFQSGAGQNIPSAPPIVTMDESTTQDTTPEDTGSSITCPAGFTFDGIGCAPN